MKKRLLAICIFIAYWAVLMKVMVFKDVPTLRIGQLMLNFGGIESGRPPNLIPFKTILPYLFGYKDWIIAGINLVGNIALLVPIGFLLTLIFRNISWKKSLIVAVVSGFAIEILQTILHVGIFDIDDVILNALGVMIGYVAYIFFTKLIREKKFGYIGMVGALVVAAAVGALYMVYPHGQPVVNTRVGAGDRQVDSSSIEEEKILHGVDLCGGTGGTGEIIGKEGGEIAMKRKDGVVEMITITAQTDIRNSTGSIFASDLKIGDHVTVVIMDDNNIATTVLVCTVSGSENR